MESFEVTKDMLDYLVERAITAHIDPDSSHAYRKLEDAWAAVEAGSKKWGSFKVDKDDLEYLLERAITAHISPDSTHAYQKLQEAWTQVEKQSAPAIPSPN